MKKDYDSNGNAALLSAIARANEVTVAARELASSIRWAPVYRMHYFNALFSGDGVSVADWRSALRSIECRRDNALRVLADKGLTVAIFHAYL